MCDGVDRNFGVGVSIYDRVGKAIAQASASAMRVARPRVWEFNDAINGRKDFIVKVITEAIFASVVELDRCLKLGLRLWVDRMTHLP